VDAVVGPVGLLQAASVRHGLRLRGIRGLHHRGLFFGLRHLHGGGLVALVVVVLVVVVLLMLLRRRG
jgi:hypothetical protein